MGSVSSIRSATDSSSPPHSVDLEREEFPGGDAMLEVLTRLQSYQESMQLQLEVRVFFSGRVVALVNATVNRV